MLDYARSDSHYLIPLYTLYQQIFLGHQVWLREDVQVEPWVPAMKTAKVRKGLQELATVNNQLTLEKVLKANNRKVNLVLKN